MSLNEVPITPEARLKALAEQSSVDVNSSLKVIQYVRTGKEIIRSAEDYYRDGHLDYAYFLYMRFLTLSLEKIKEHPGYKRDLGSVEKTEMRVTCQRVLPIAEKIKAELQVQYQVEYEEYIKALKLQAAKDERREAEKKAKLEEARIAASVMPFNVSPANFPGFMPSAASPYNVAQDMKPIAALAGISAVNYDFGNTDSIRNGAKATPTPISLHPQFDRRSKPSRLMSPMGTDSLRMVIIPGDLISKFTSLASSNTVKNIETCGVLCGKIIREQLVITHLVLPKQTGTPDSCTTLNEEEIYTIIDRFSLIQMGWIHTHPSQTSFLSSVDLHTHLSYQLMMPESIAIVCAPSKQEHNVFTLTVTGMESLQKCADSGFHPHPQLEEPYFTDANHASFEPSRYIIVEDLRH